MWVLREDSGIASQPRQSKAGFSDHRGSQIVEIPEWSVQRYRHLQKRRAPAAVRDAGSTKPQGEEQAMASMDLDLCYLTATEAIEQFKAKKLSPVELMKALLLRCEAVN